MAESLAPIDTSVSIPPAVKAAAARAEAYYQTPATPEQTPEPQAQAPEPAPAPLDANTTPPPPVPSPPVDARDNIGHMAETEQLREQLAKQQRDYNALMGRNAQQREYIAMQQGQLQMLSNPRSWANPNAQNQQHRTVRPLITEEEKREYGDALSVMERKAREVVQPVVERLAEKNQQLEREIQKVKSNDTYQVLNQQMPNWREINRSQPWRDWLTLPDLYSGVVRQTLLDRAFAAGDSERVLAFLRGFLAEYPEHAGQQSPTHPAAQPSQPVRKAAMKLEDLAAPGRASPSPPDAGTDNQPVITNKDVTRFYADITHGRYAGREAEKDAREAQIHAAVRTGRVQIVK